MASRLNRFLISCVIAIVIVTSSFVAFQLDYNSRWRIQRWPKGIPVEHPTHFSYDDMTFSPPARPVTLEDIVQSLWKPLVTPITDESFVDHNGAVQTLGDKAEQHWKQPLGKKLCIVDIDTRPLSGDHQIFNPGNVAWKDLDTLGSGMLNHYLYGTFSLRAISVSSSTHFQILRFPVLENHDVCFISDLYYVGYDIDNFLVASGNHRYRS